MVADLNAFLKKGCKMRAPMSAILALTFFPSAVSAQNMTCGSAQFQLQQYIFQVNSFANTEIGQNIPYRCGFNSACFYWWKQQLDGWYAQQAAQVNGWYFQIVRQCTNEAGSTGPIISRNSQDKINEKAPDRVEDLPIDDEDKTVAIRIPARPPAFRD